jgi:hypothetical protein
LVGGGNTVESSRALAIGTRPLPMGVTLTAAVEHKSGVDDKRNRK